ncbi:AAA family ATPase [Myxococcus sp. CA051A]|uniref:AAA family ATPase n=1 Tax=Myxococcus sp. CA051A TaxID=2741739 RepID=UPI00157AF5AA|nr:AAA family ATPase [Myxococcus sp. CA051A]NTX66078.1 AAA family ATPase [Myxococcus sp. CA051A]
MLKLQWLQVHQFRSVNPGTRLSFSPSFNVLLGRNGTGKTLLLDLLAAVASSDFTAMALEPFELEYALSADTGRITVRVRNVPVMPQDGPAGSGLSMDIVVSPRDMAWPLVIRREGLQVTVSREGDTSLVVQERLAPEVAGRLWLVLMSGGIAWVEKTGEGTATVEPLLAMAREVSALAGLSRFDEGLAYFEQLYQVELRLSRRAEGVLATGTGLASEALLDGLRRLAAAQWGSARYVVPSDAVPFLRDASRLLGFTSAEASLVPLEASPEGKYESLTLGGLELDFLGPGDTRVSARQLGHGQKRLLALQHYLARARAVVVVDEVAHSLHPQLVRASVEPLKGRQSFFTSQSPVLMDLLAFESAEHVRASLVVCRREEDTGLLTWEDPSPEVAERLFTASAAAPGQMGALLQAQGLW